VTTVVRACARARGKSIGGAAVTDETVLAAALQRARQELSLRDIVGRFVIATVRRKPASLASDRDAHAGRA
jgi:hypothetical protein